MKRWSFAAVIAAGFLVAGCGGQAPAEQPSPTPTTVAAAPTSAATEWSPEAVTACRTFVNSVPNMTLVQSQIRQTKPTMTADELSVAKTGWGLATAGMNLPASIGVTAEPEVHQALAAVAKASDASVTSPDYVQANATAFSDAIAVCTEVGVIP